MSIAMLAWLCALAAFAWFAFGEGYTGMLLPIWNSLFAVATVPIVTGVFSRRLWAQRWVVGISAFTGIGNAWQAAQMDSSLLWFGAALLATVALTVRRAKPLFNDSDGNRGTLQQVIATVVTIGSIVISLQTMQGSGTERGRERFAAEVQESYDRAGAGTVRVHLEGLALVIESMTDTEQAIDSAAEILRGQLATAGARAKAWVVGLKQIVITNGSYRRVLTPDDTR